MTDIRIGPGELDRDIDAVLAIDAVCFVNPWTRAMYEWEARHSDVAYLFVARSAPEADRIVAYCAAWIVFDEVHINNVAVLPEWRRQRVATRLLEHVLAEAARRGAPRATLEVRRSNEAARNLYERLGFAVTAVRQGYYRDPVEDALVLWRDGSGSLA